MKVYLAKYDASRLGGGWTFMRNFVRGMGELVTDNYDEANIYFIASPSMVTREEVIKSKGDGKKIVLRLDNAVRNSRNRNTGMTRMKDFCDWADLVIYQSEWAKNYLMPFTKKDGIVILNGLDINLYSDSHLESHSENILYSRFNRDETKNWEVARYWYSQYQLEHPDAMLYIVGQFSDELRDGNFDFYNGERFKYLGVATETSMINLYGICQKFLYTYYNDACSNSLIEALVSGCQIVGDKYYRNTGGSTEIREAFRQSGREYFSLERMCDAYRGVMTLL